MARYLITGCDRGIGLALAHHLSARGDEVIATCLGAGPEGDAGALRVEPHVDVADDRSVAALDDRLGDLRLDVVISNAGVQRKLSLKKLDFASMSRQFEVNALGPLRVVAALRHRLGEGGKIALISSRMGLPGPTRSSGGNYGYRMSKAALNVAGVALARDLKRDGIAVALLHPGWVQTSMTRGKGSLTPQQSARGLVERIDALTLQETGGFWNVDGERLPW